MDHDVIVEPWLDRCQRVIENIVQAPDLHRVASAALTIFAQMRPVARDMLQAKIDLEAQKLKSQDVALCGQEAGMTDIHTRPVSPQTWFGEGWIPGRMFPWARCGASLRPDDHHMGVPEAGDCTDDGRFLYAPVVAERPHRVANDLLPRYTGVALSSREAQGILDRTAEDLSTWQAERARQEAEGPELRVEIAMEGVMAHLDGRWQAARTSPYLISGAGKALLQNAALKAHGLRCADPMRALPDPDSKHSLVRRSFSMEPERQEYQGHHIELREREGKPELLINNIAVRYGQLPNGSYFLHDYAYDWTDNLMELARRFVDYRRKADKIRLERDYEKGRK